MQNIHLLALLQPAELRIPKRIPRTFPKGRRGEISKINWCGEISKMYTTTPEGFISKRRISTALCSEGPHATTSKLCFCSRTAKLRILTLTKYQLFNQNSQPLSPRTSFQITSSTCKMSSLWMYVCDCESVWKCAYVCICMCERVYVYMCVCVCACMCALCVCIFVWASECVNVVWMCMWRCVCMHVCMCAYVHVRMYICVYMRMYVRVQLATPPLLKIRKSETMCRG